MRNAKIVSPIESNIKISKEMCPKTEDEKREMMKNGLIKNWLEV